VEAAFPAFLHAILNTNTLFNKKRHGKVINTVSYFIFSILLYTILGLLVNFEASTFFPFFIFQILYILFGVTETTKNYKVPGEESVAMLGRKNM
jgi:uncharacterized membrane protein HdeD (DUF308 family)